MKVVSVIIPTFNEAKYGYLPKILKQLSNFQEIEIICVDSYSHDGTLELIKSYPQVKLYQIHTSSRAARLNLGLQHTSAELIVLHHPRSILESSAIAHLLKNKTSLIWGGFTHKFDQEHPLLNFTSWYSNRVRARIKHIFYLDHIIFVNKSLLTQIKGVPELDIFEDTALSEKLNKIIPPRLLPFNSTTSAIRFRTNGIYKQSLKNQLLKFAYMFGLSDKKMNKYYEKNIQLNTDYKENQK